MAGKYGYRHQQLRKQWKARVDAGECACTRCGMMIVPGTKWHLDHSDDGKSYLGPAHERCNTRVGGRHGALVANPRRRMVRRNWSSREW